VDLFRDSFAFLADFLRSRAAGSHPEREPPMTTTFVLAAVAAIFFLVEAYQAKPGDPL
jgi:hypothetical protein